MAEPKLKLDLTIATFDALHEAADGRGKFTKVDKQTLTTLLTDHSRAVRKLKELGVEIEEDAI